MTHPVRLFSTLARLFERAPADAGPREGAPVAASGTVLALAIVLVHIAGGDGRVKEGERGKLADIIGSRFGLARRAALRIVEEAVSADRTRETIDDAFEELNRALPREGRRELMALAWDLAKADGSIVEIEDDLLWRSARRLGLSEREAEALRQAALADAQGGT